MTFMEALKESANGHTVLSENKSYTPEELDVRFIGDTVAITKAITSERERKGNWRAIKKNNESLDILNDILANTIWKVGE